MLVDFDELIKLFKVTTLRRLFNFKLRIFIQENFFLRNKFICQRKVFLSTLNKKKIKDQNTSRLLVTKKRVFATNSDFLLPKSLQPNVVAHRYFII